MRARDLMTTPVETVDADDDVSEVLTRLARADFSGYPVVEDGRLVGVVTQRDLVHLFQPSDRTLWVPIGLPPFLETVEYGFDLSWDDLDVGIDLLRNAGRPVREVMTPEPISVGPDATLAELLDVLATDDPDVNRVPVVEDGRVVGIVTRQDLLEGVREAGLA